MVLYTPTKAYISEEVTSASNFVQELHVTYFFSLFVGLWHGAFLHFND